LVVVPRHGIRVADKIVGIGSGSNRKGSGAVEAANRLLAAEWARFTTA
jgi:hypothetical protein